MENITYWGDCLDLMNNLSSESIDLIYIDPPFFSNKNYKLKNKEQGFKDIYIDIEQYLGFLNIRFLEMRRILKLTGNIVVHLDSHAVHYVKINLDKIFGYNNFINEIIWKYGLGNATAKRNFLKKHDTLLYYSKTPEYYFKMLRGDITSAQKAKYSHKDKKGTYMLSYGRKYYFKGGKPLEDVWEIPNIAATSKERTGYPTQKPEALLEIIIKSLCPLDGIVADFFAGSGTTPVVAKKLGRSYIACDISNIAIEITKQRLNTPV